jgi:hypothetical protein
MTRAIGIVRRVAIAAVFGGLLSGCAHLGAQPWERDLLAKPTMQPNAGIDLGLDDHIYFSKEASSGGRGFGGGGCGCN